jgi:hypothetical protein
MSTPARPLDPFIFPSETRGRFRLLVVAALLVGLNLAQVVVEVTRGQADRVRLTKALEEYGGIKIIDPSNPNRAELEDMLRKYYVLSKACLPIIAGRLLIPAQALTLLTILAVGIYTRHPRRVRCRHQPLPLSEEQAPEVVGYLRRCAERLGVPGLRIEHRPGFGEGQAYGLRGREALLLYGSPGLLERGWGNTLKTIVLHELGHVVNRDAADREKARAVWKALLVVLCLGMAIVGVFVLQGAIHLWSAQGARVALRALLALAGKACVLGWPFVGLLLVVRLIQAGLIRSRELYADWRVASWGFGGTLDRLLQMRERRRDRWWERLWGLHPSYQLRREVLADPRRLFRVSPDLAFVTGVLLMVVLGSGFPLLIQLGFLVSAVSGVLAGVAPSAGNPSLLLLEMLFLQGLPALLFLCASLAVVSYLVTGTLGVQVQREAVADLAGERPSRSWGYLRLLVPALLLSLGMEVGHLLAPLSPLPTVLARPALLPVWFVGFTLFTWLWLVYVRAATRLSLGIRLGSTDPRRLRSFVLLSAIFLLTVLYWPAAVMRVASMIQANQLPPWLTGAQDSREHYVYSYVMTPMMLAVFASVIYLFWAGAGLVAASLSLLRRRNRCPACGDAVSCGFAIGRICHVCGNNLAPWVYLKPSIDPGSPEPVAETPWTAPS